MALRCPQFGKAVAHLAHFDPGGHLLWRNRGGGDHEVEVATGLALDPAAGDVAALLLFTPSCLPCCEALGLEVLRLLGPGTAELALPCRTEGRAHPVAPP